MNAITNLIQISTSTSSGNVEALGWEPNATAFFNIFRMAMLFVYIKSVSVAGARWVKMWVRYYTSVKSTPFFMKSVLQALTVQIKNSLGLVILQWHARIDCSSIICISAMADLWLHGVVPSHFDIIIYQKSYIHGSHWWCMMHRPYSILLAY